VDPPPPRTKWTRRVPHPVLTGHVSSLLGTGERGGGGENAEVAGAGDAPQGPRGGKRAVGRVWAEEVEEEEEEEEEEEDSSGGAGLGEGTAAGAAARDCLFHALSAAMEAAEGPGPPRDRMDASFSPKAGPSWHAMRTAVNASLYAVRARALPTVNGSNGRSPASQPTGPPRGGPVTRARRRASSLGAIGAARDPCSRDRRGFADSARSTASAEAGAVPRRPVTLQQSDFTVVT